ncbi:histidine kinase [Marinobacter vulgaris]|uniref:Histidine kinase n=1 Tax=Marinobacter vulgaris TaxID=1928331 RepID=A0A2V3ZKJ7_9GAMM|nr:Hpt domain-containing protein [Marinobacter vulgaris]PXX91023.1 histidine kinase [Marinobacter vulgaris]TSJ69994.1 Hpt domain-containing protein [Marinobacter vulgaris]
MTDKPHLDQEALTELQDVMEDEFDILINTYIKDSADRIAHLRSALAQEDADRFSRSAHSFKGSCINIGAPRLGELCSEAEQAGRSNRLGEAAAMVEAIESEFRQVEKTLRRFLE